jgi:hypothetical protein
VKLEYAPEILERLRLLSIDGLLALPRVGMSIGGFLTGSVENGRVRVSDAIEIPCSHANGPGFVLTGPELAKASSLAFGEGRRLVVGWYCSKPRGELLLDPQQSGLFSEICPEPWQIGLIIRPSTVEATRVSMCARVGGDRTYVVGQAMELVEYAAPVRHLPVDDVLPEVVSRTAELGAKPEFVASDVVPQHFVPGDFAEPRSAKPDPTKTDFSAPSPPTVPSPPAPFPQARHEVPPIRTPFDRALAQPADRPVRFYILMAIAAIVLLTVLYLNRFSFIPRPPLEIKMTETEGQILVQWNPEALEGIDEGRLVLNDGGQFETIELNKQLLASGWMRSPRKSERVTAKLTAGDITGLGSWSAPQTDSPPAVPDAGKPAAPAPAR